MKKNDPKPEVSQEKLINVLGKGKFIHLQNQGTYETIRGCHGDEKLNLALDWAAASGKLWDVKVGGGSEGRDGKGKGGDYWTGAQGTKTKRLTTKAKKLSSGVHKKGRGG